MVNNQTADYHVLRNCNYILFEELFENRIIDPSGMRLCAECNGDIAITPLILNGQSYQYRDDYRYLFQNESRPVCYGYTINIPQKMFDTHKMYLLNGGALTLTGKEEEGNTSGIQLFEYTDRSIEDLLIDNRLFHLTIQAPSYKGSSIHHYVTFRFPVCMSTMHNIDLNSSFYQPVYTITAFSTNGNEHAMIMSNLESKYDCSQIPQSAPPIIKHPANRQAYVDGYGVYGATVYVTMPNATTYFVPVDQFDEETQQGYWYIDYPNRVVTGQIIYAYQIEPGKLRSDLVSQVVGSGD